MLISQQLCADEDGGVQDGGMVEDLLLWWSSVDCVKLWSPRGGVLLGRHSVSGEGIHLALPGLPGEIGRQRQGVKG